MVALVVLCTFLTAVDFLSDTIAKKAIASRLEYVFVLYIDFIYSKKFSSNALGILLGEINIEGFIKVIRRKVIPGKPSMTAWKDINLAFATYYYLYAGTRVLKMFAKRNHHQII